MSYFFNITHVRGFPFLNERTLRFPSSLDIFLVSHNYKIFLAKHLIKFIALNKQRKL